MKQFLCDCNARLLTVNGDGHTSMYVEPSTCRDTAQAAYLISVKLPPAGTVCPVDHLPFGLPSHGPAAPGWVTSRHRWAQLDDPRRAWKHASAPVHNSGAVPDPLADGFVIATDH